MKYIFKRILELNIFVNLFYHKKKNRSKSYIVTILFLNLWFSLNAQNNVTVSGYVKDANTGENLYTATVYALKSFKGTIVNRYGFYSLSFPRGDEVQLIFSFVGYTSNSCSFYLSNDTTINISLISSNEIDEVTVKANMSKINMHGHRRIQMKDLEKLPSFLGEKDVMKSLMLLPGVQQGNEGSSGIYVRGGSPDQNLILLDDVPLYNASHLFGFTSVFTPEALQSVDFYKGNFPARFGGRLSSIIDVRMKDGNKYDDKTDITLGILSSKFIHEGPIKKGKSSYIISARRTLLDLFVTGMSKVAQKSQDESTIPGYRFYDLNAKINFEINETNRLHFSFYNGGDKLFVNYNEKIETLLETKIQENKMKMKWGNTIAAIKLNSQISPKLFANTIINWSHFFYNISSNFYGLHSIDKEDHVNNFSLDYNSHVVSFEVKSDWDYYWKNNLTSHFGFFAKYSNYLPGEQLISRNDKFSQSSSENLFSNEYGFYFDLNLSPLKHFDIVPGLRTSIYSVGNKSYPLIEPRLSVLFQNGSQTKWSASYSTMTQAIHLLTSSNIGLPSDIWVPSTSNIIPERSNQVSIGREQRFNGKIKLNTEIYYKQLKNVVAYKQGFGLMSINEDWENNIDKGIGRAYGIENQLKYDLPNLQSWIGYTLAWNQRKFENHNNNEWFSHKFDRRHKLDIGFIYKLNKKWSVSSNWTFQTGVPSSLSGFDYPGFPDNINYGWHDIFTGIELEDTDRIQYYPQLNKNRLPAYHRLDISFTKEWKKGHVLKQLSLGLYNTYNRLNPYFIFPKVSNAETTVYKQVSLIPILPSISYRVRF